jgi:solute carrier family 38 (sodium-coupled neutral amino acid transporter), member 11
VGGKEKFQFISSLQILLFPSDSIRVVSVCFVFIQNEEQPVDDSLSTLSETSFNYINSIVGSGVIGIPYALVRAGYGVGLILLIFVAVITDYSLRLMVSTIDFLILSTKSRDSWEVSCLNPFAFMPFLLLPLILDLSFLLLVLFCAFIQIKTAHLSGRLSYPSVMESAFGSAGYYLLSFLQFLYPFLGKIIV